METAYIILQQLGGHRFIAMTGAKHLGSTGNSLSFHLPSRFAKNGINAVRITFDLTDTYTMSFIKMKKYDLQEVAKHSDVYNDQLRAIFTAETGLDCTL